MGKEIVLYANLPYNKYRWYGYISAAQVGFVLFSLIVMPTPRIIEERKIASDRRDKRRDVNPGEQSLERTNEPVAAKARHETATLWQRLRRFDYSELLSPGNFKENIVDRPYLSVGMLGATSLISFAFYIYTHRIAHVITLLPNQRVRFESFSAFAFGRPRSVELSVRDVSCVVGRKSPNNYSILKFKGYRGYHLVHKTEGIFLEPKLYDEYLGYERSWYKN